MMLDRLRSLVGSSFALEPAKSPDFGDVDVPLAAAALLFEAAGMDGDVEAADRERIRALLRKHYGLRGPDKEALLARAESMAFESADHHRFTSTLKEELDEAERVELIEMLWAVVYVDGKLTDYESNLLRRIAGLLYVSDRDSGDARKRVLERLGRG